MKIAILGGTFNPPHYAHMFLANEVRTQLNYDKVVFVPSNIPAHKSTQIDPLHRLEMTRLITSQYDWAYVSDCDIRRGGVTRSIDTVDDIKKEFNLKGKPGFIIGDDLVQGINSWKNPEFLFERCNLIIAVRDGIAVADIKYKHETIKNRIFPLSSSELRERVSNNFNIDFLVPPNVIKYISDNGLYR